MTENDEDNGYLFPQIPEDAIREPFNFVEWEGFAVTQDELKAIQELLGNPQLSAQFAQLYAKGKSVRNIDGQVELAALESSTQLGIRYDGPIVILNTLNHQQYPPNPKANNDSFRKKIVGKGIFLTALAETVINSDGKVVNIIEITNEELKKRVTRTTDIYTESALLEAVNSLLLPQTKSSELELGSLSETLRSGEDLESYAESFKVEGTKLSEYLNRVRKERGSILWGVSNSITKKPEYLFGHGDFSGLNEIDIRNPNGVVPASEFSFLAVKPNTFEDKLGQMCQSKVTAI